MTALYDFVDRRQVNVIAEWTRGLSAQDRARLHSRLELLKRVDDPMQLPKFVFKVPGSKEIRYLKVGASGSESALRPLVCLGPFQKNSELTLLVGVKKHKTIPGEAVALAERRRQELLVDPGRRRVHEPIE